MTCSTGLLNHDHKSARGACWGRDEATRARTVQTMPSGSAAYTTSTYHVEPIITVLAAHRLANFRILQMSVVALISDSCIFFYPRCRKTKRKRNHDLAASGIVSDTVWVLNNPLTRIAASLMFLQTFRDSMAPRSKACKPRYRGCEACRAAESLFERGQAPSTRLPLRTLLTPRRARGARPSRAERLSQQEELRRTEAQDLS